MVTEEVIFDLFSELLAEGDVKDQPKILRDQMFISALEMYIYNDPVKAEELSKSPEFNPFLLRQIFDGEAEATVAEVKALLNIAGLHFTYDDNLKTFPEASNEFC